MSTVIEFSPSLKQHQAMDYLTRVNGVTEVLYGGAAGGGKSFLGAAWIIISSMKYPGTRWLVARERLVDIRHSIMKTFINLLREWGVAFNVNYADNVIKFSNGSEIFFKEVKQQPGDEDFDRLGSIEITGAFVEEAAQVSRKAVEVLSSRIRYRLDEYGLVPKLLMTCNPTKGWLYTEFYMPWTDDSMAAHRVFIPATLDDNKYISRHYREQLEKLDNVNRKRLLYGDWLYSASDYDIYTHKALRDAFDRAPVGVSYSHLSVDVGHLGDDKTVICIWMGLHCDEIEVLSKQDTKQVAARIREILVRTGIRDSNVVIDCDGIGAGVRDQLTNFVIPLRNAAQPFRLENFKNLKTQLAFKLAEMLPVMSFGHKCAPHFQSIAQELGCVKRTNVDSDGKVTMTSKDAIRTAIARSPDFFDAIIYRMYWEAKYSGKKTILF